ncbi:MAG: DUF2357 domain-containing protein [Bacteroides sp.]|nr:DUF2357 domain-containing protein [Bacteroides sp.]
MDLLCIEHQDFTMQIDCDKFQTIWDKAVGNVHRENLYSTYEWSEGVERVCRNGNELSNGKRGEAVFFDNADYPIWVEFKNAVKDASFNSPIRKVADSFKFHEKRQILSGYINYGNEIGRSEIIIHYILDSGERKRFIFKYDVLSTKLNYHEHWREIILGIEQEYRMLSIDFLKKTFHSFDTSSKDEPTHDLIWWQIFKPLRDEFIESCKRILDRPRHRLRNREIYQRADRIKRFSPLLENEYARFKNDVGHLYRTEEAETSNDTYENRFLKFALKTISEKHATLGAMILSNADIPNTRVKEIQAAIEELDSLNYHPFFRTVGSFKGVSQESMILQHDTHYSSVYRTWLILTQSYSLNEGLHNLETKDIATLYEIWCYIQMKEIVKKQLGEGIEIDNSSRIELNGAFRYELGKGDKSRIIFKKNEVELAELIYNPVHGESDRRNINIDHLVTKTVPQKPDIVLRLTKNEQEHGIKLTYLFDAKYRIDGKDSSGVDTPPEDAINQMHRYRDAIYYSENNGTDLKKEIIGGYILFPGTGEPAQTQVARFYKSIDDVNIGAFPLRPKDNENRRLLEVFISRLLSARASSLLSQSNIIPQKGLKYFGDETIFGKDEPCLVCYTAKARLDNVLKSLIYYVRTGDKDGAFPYSPEVAAISKVILIPLNRDEDLYVYEVDGPGPRIVNGKYLQDKKGFVIKKENEVEPYLAYDLKNVVRVPLSNFNLAALPGNAWLTQKPYILRKSDISTT